jgi:hypothetical protein
MIYVIIKNGLVKAKGEYQDLWRNVGFPDSGPTSEFLEKMGAVPYDPELHDSPAPDASEREAAVAAVVASLGDLEPIEDEILDVGEEPHDAPEVESDGSWEALVASFGGRPQGGNAT